MIKDLSATGRWSSWQVARVLGKRNGGGQLESCGDYRLGKGEVEMTVKVPSSPGISFINCL